MSGAGGPGAARGRGSPHAASRAAGWPGRPVPAGGRAAAEAEAAAARCSRPPRMLAEASRGSSGCAPGGVRGPAGLLPPVTAAAGLRSAASPSAGCPPRANP